MGDFPTLPAILDGVETDYAMSHETMLGHGRTPHIAEGRHVAMYLARTLPMNNRTRSYPVIGHGMERHHTSVIHGVAHITERLIDDAELRKTVTRIRTGLCEPVT
jgi:chromosomal replication initiation ATPase DnaA